MDGIPGKAVKCALWLPERYGEVFDTMAGILYIRCMKAKWLILILLLPVAAFSQIGKDDEIMSSWVGKHQAELIRSWGAPDRVTSDGKGGKVLVYVQTYGSVRQEDGEYDTEIDNYGRAIKVWKPGQTIDDRFRAFRSFFVNPKGIIYYYRWEYK